MRVLGPAIFLCSLLFAHCAFAGSGEVNVIGCSIFDQHGKLLKKYLGWVCAFYPNGKMIIGDGYTLTFYDEKMNIAWAKDMHVHNSINYSAADDTTLLIASHVLPDNTRGERLEVYDNQGRLIKHFNFTSEHSRWKGPFGYDRRILPSKVMEESHHVDSFYRIPKNRSRDSAFREGNYIATELVGFFYIFDSSLTKILKKISFRDYKMESPRDVQVTEAGTLIIYNSANKDAQGKPFTTLDEWDPKTGKVVWQYKAKNPTDFYGYYEGNIQLLPNNHVLFSVVLDERKGSERIKVPAEVHESWMDIQGNHQAIEITREGKEVWRMVTKDDDLSGKPNVIKRYDLSSYLRKKGHY